MKKINAILPSLFSIIIDSLSFSLFYPMIAAFLKDDHFSSITNNMGYANFYLGLAFMLHPLGMLFGSAILGNLSDSFGRKRVLATSLMGLTFGFLLIGIGFYAANIFMLLAGRLLTGLTSGSQIIAQAIIIDVSKPDERTQNMRYVTISLSLGYIFGPLIGGILSDPKIFNFFNPSVPFLVSSVLSFFNLIWVILALQETLLIRSSKKVNLMSHVTTFLKGFSNNSVRKVSIAYFMMQIGFSLFFQIMPIYLKSKYNYSNLTIGLFTGYLGVGFLFSILAIVSQSKKYNLVNFTILCLIITSICQLLISCVGNQIGIWGLSQCLVIADMTALTLILSLFSYSTNLQSQGWVMGLSGSLRALSWATTGMLSPILASLFGLPTVIFVGGLFILLSAVAISTWKPIYSLTCLNPEKNL